MAKKLRWILLEDFKGFVKGLDFKKPLPKSKRGGGTKPLPLDDHSEEIRYYQEGIKTILKVLERYGEKILPDKYCNKLFIDSSKLKEELLEFQSLMNLYSQQ